MTTRNRKVTLILLGDGHENSIRGLKDDILKLTRGLYDYVFEAEYGLKVEMTNDQIVQEFPVARSVLDYKCDEVWIWGCEKSGSAMGGRNAFWLGDPSVPTAENVYRRFPIMRFGENEHPLRTYARRVENTMYYVYRGYPPAKNQWEKFIRNDRSHPSHASCGSVAYPPNGIINGYASKSLFMSNADDWNFYPEFRDRVRWMDSSEWGGTMLGYLRWWLGHLPHGLHKTDGIHDTWWHYVMNLDLVR